MLFQDQPDFLDKVESIARAGAVPLVHRFRTLTADQVTEKQRNDHVSVADEEAETAIVAMIEEHFPGHAILSEESGWHHRAPDRPTWVVDPLDGTTNFVHGIAQFAVSVGLVIDDEVRYGVIYDPIKNDVFRAARGCGATWNGAPCVISPKAGLEGSLLATGFPFKAHHLLDRFLAIFRDVFLRCKAIRRTGSAALDLAYTAAGVYDGFFEFSLSPWDIAAGTLLVEEAGGVVRNMEGGNNVMDEGNVLCGPAGVVDELLEVVSDNCEPQRRQGREENT